MGIEGALDRAIHAVVPAADVKILLVNSHATGVVVAKEFESLTHLDRQKLVWDRIRRDLGADAQDVGILFLYTPEEFSAVEEDDHPEASSA